MALEELPKDVLHFLDNCIDSIEQLRVLLLLHSDPDRTWTAAEITAELRSAETSIAKRLDSLYERTVLIRDPSLNERHRFIPGTPEVKSVIDELSKQNQRRPYRVIEAIYSRPQNAIQQFADAFKLRGDKK